MADCEAVLPWIKAGWTGAEIGVSEGASALAFLQHGVKKLYLIDRWLPYEGYGEDHSADRKVCLAKLADYLRYKKASVVEKWSAEAAPDFADDSLDFVFVDGNHRYEWVKSDLDLYWPKVRSGGVLCGHDYTNNPTCQVAQAVDEFAAARGLAVLNPAPCWVILK